MRRRIQLAVAVGIILIIAALAVPAIQRAREAANQTRCRQNLGNLAQAAFRYCDEFKHLPPGYLGPKPDTKEMTPAPYAGVLVFLLPYMVAEDDAPWEPPYLQMKIDAQTEPPIDPDTKKPNDPPSNVPWWELTNLKTGRSNRQLARRQFDFLHCPSADASRPSEGMIVALHSYAKDGYFEGFLKRKVITIKDDADVRSWGTTHYLGVAGRLGTMDDCDGYFTNRWLRHYNSSMSIRLVSQSLMFGEATGGFATADPTQGRTRETAYSWFCGPLPTYYGLPELNRQPWYAFNGPHPGGVMVVWSDGNAGLFRRSHDSDDEHTFGIDGNPIQRIKSIVPMKGHTTEINSNAWKYLQKMASPNYGINHFYPANIIE